MLLAALAAGNFRTLPAHTTIAQGVVLTTWFTTKVSSFARVVADCADYTNAHHAETASIMAAAGSVGVAVINRMQPVMNGSVLWPALIQPAINVTAILRSIDGDVPGQRYHRRARCDIESLPPDFCLAAHANVIL
jgi:hypothetical protein